ncbi:MAG TPA: UbiA-like polyprenyltransferase [Candidatus Polarisedimenticolia bacterium]|nr:UbiA-like polyprenyltransferase [Candidatus Polarisedimenticolia bacterium]
MARASDGPRRPFGALGATLSMIKFQHTVFALPFALSAALLAAGGMPPWPTLGWILGAMVGARSAAMVFNRIVDRELDRMNPRTATRPLVTGELGLPFAWAFLAASLALFFLSAAMLNRLALLLATPVIVVLLSYSFAKRVTWLAHLHLGASLGLAPLGAWVAVTGRIEAAPLLLGAGVMLWVGGFDVLYACQDADFDRGAGLHAIPARFGIPRALVIARALHFLAVVAWFGFGAVLALGYFWYVGVSVAALLLAWEHTLVRADDLRRVNQAFFTMNGVISFLILAATIGEVASR